MPVPVDGNGDSVYIPQTNEVINKDQTKVTKVGKEEKIGAVLDSVEPKKPSIPKFTSGNSQSDGKNSLKRFEFEFDGKSYKFVLNPEEYDQTEPSRVNVTQTKGGAFVDDFGGGVPTVVMSGTTGFKNGTKDPTSGFKKFKELRDLIREYYFGEAPGSAVKASKELTFHNHTDGEHWIAVPTTFSLKRSVARPLLYLYNIEMILVRPAKEPNASSKSSDLKTSLPQNKVG
ncbi:hypothetical protein [Bacillus phage SPO1L4]|nr:hypothetical protein [Bacillus phage SPO1L4]